MTSMPLDETLSTNELSIIIPGTTGPEPLGQPWTCQLIPDPSQVPESHRVAVWLTEWGYPLSGAEEFFQQSRNWLTGEWTVIWISFRDSMNQPYTQIELQGNQDHYDLHLPLNVDLLTQILQIIQPEFVHHHGTLRLLCLEVCRNLDIPVITGYHYWTGLINPQCYYQMMTVSHPPDPELEHVQSYQPLMYCVSEFMQELVFQNTRVRINPIIEPIPEPLPRISGRRHYVTQVNIHSTKGGSILLSLIQSYPQIPFCAIQCQPHSLPLDQAIQMALQGHGKYLQRHRDCIDMSRIYAETYILVIPSHVDETFCRVAMESLLAEIPVITTGAGNIRSILGNTALYAQTPDDWATQLYRLYYDTSLYQRHCEMIRQRQTQFSVATSQQRFKDLINQAIHRS
jgi:glycosyltransferase involved in cell wall biosynthesis